MLFRSDEYRLGPHPGPAKRWPVPVTYTGADGHTGRVVLDRDVTTLTLPGCGAVLVNSGAGGYYRVDYDAASFDALAQHFNDLSVSDRIALVRDRLALARTGTAPVSDVMRLIAATPVDAPAPVWNGLISVLESLHELTTDRDPGRAALEARIRALVSDRKSTRLNSSH